MGRISRFEKNTHSLDKVKYTCVGTDPRRTIITPIITRTITAKCHF